MNAEELGEAIGSALEAHFRGRIGVIKNNFRQYEWRGLTGEEFLNHENDGMWKDDVVSATGLGLSPEEVEIIKSIRGEWERPHVVRLLDLHESKTVQRYS